MTEKRRNKPGAGAPVGNKSRLIGDKPANAHIHVRVIPEEKAEFQAKADSEGLKLSEWVLKNLRSAVGK